jgi:hypothetical protein
MVPQNSIISNAARYLWSSSVSSNSSLHGYSIRVKDNFKQTGSNKELFDLMNNDCFVGDTWHLVDGDVT